MVDAPKFALPIDTVITAAAAGNPLLVAFGRELANELIARTQKKPITTEDIPEVTTAAITKVQATPEGTYASGTDRWYQSRANWSKISGVATAVFAAFGITISADVQQCVAVFGSLASPAVAFVLAGLSGVISAWFSSRERKASRPIGTGFLSSWFSREPSTPGAG